MTSPNEPIKQVDPLAGYIELKGEIDAAIQKVLASGWYILGEEVSRFEEELASSLGVRVCLGVANGTEALQLGLWSLSIGVDDVVLCPSHTAVATVAAVELAGAKPLLVDIDPQSYTIDPDKLEQTVKAHYSSGALKAIVAVHLYGHPAEMSSILDIANRYDLKVIEDCAQAQGALYKGRPVGSLGDIGTFSFYPTKNLGALGDGGALTIRDEEVAERAAALRQYGWRERFISSEAGMNTRLDELQAAILRVKLKNLDRQNFRRQSIASVYSKQLQERHLHVPHTRTDVDHVFHQYVVRSSMRDQLMAQMSKSQIGVAVHYPVPVHLQPAYRGRIEIGAGGMEHTEDVCSSILSLPMYPQLSDGDVDTICYAINRWQDLADC
jgi:dTDP-4-amino-4,6-dideoxygalactose transaminase